MTKPMPHIPQTAFDQEYFELLECVAVGSYKEEPIEEAMCLSMCQRPENPCIVDINFTLFGDGTYEWVPSLTMFSLDSTNGKDGTWHLLQPVLTDSKHWGEVAEVKGVFNGVFVADMCDHVSSFFSETKVCFRLTFRKKRDIEAPFGGDLLPGEHEDPELTPDPIPAPSGGCRQKSFGTRLPRN